jgi:propionyl-CoA carboxylase alpha chain
MRRIDSLLIANRGEIARRIRRTASQMGIRTVAVYADSDASAAYVREADAAYALGGRQARDTYLRADKLVEIARRAGVDAIHPGYGFLSEDADFARAVIAAGLVWIGPPPEAIEAMGDKLSAKQAMTAVGVPTLPSITAASGAVSAADAEAIGYPLLVKASAGGGGKGMRIVSALGELAAAVEGAAREAKAAFGDPTVFLERYVEAGRHIEVQVVGDRHGNLVHCFERECSIQRRHQKVVEEAPSPHVTPALRERLTAAALSAARAVNYSSTGTVEFLVDGDEFWFLEMNTRLQVEHPVTEEVCGVDLVREQIAVARGEPLSFGQDDLRLNGHAIEVRLYAEDPAVGFLPATGKVEEWAPAAEPALRYECGVEAGTVVGPEFDPMLAKVVAHAESREEAARRLALGLERTRLRGLITNKSFLVSVLRSPMFLAGDTTTAFIEKSGLAGPAAIAEADLRDAAILAAFAERALRPAGPLGMLPLAWRNTPMPPQLVRLAMDQTIVEVRYQPRRDGNFDVQVGDFTGLVRVLELAAGRIVADIAGALRAADFSRDGDWFLEIDGASFQFRDAPLHAGSDAAELDGQIFAPMPGTVTAIQVGEGELVEAGADILVIEAMKMEHRIQAPRRGTVQALRVQAGGQVSRGQLLAEIVGVEGSE